MTAVIWAGGAILFWLAAWRLNVRIANSPAAGTRWARIFVPALFGVTLLVLWEGLVRGFAVPPVILPAPSAVAARIGASADILWQDFRQTILKGALSGYLIGCAAGCCRWGTSWPRCRSSASRRSW